MTPRAAHPRLSRQPRRPGAVAGPRVAHPVGAVLLLGLLVLAACTPEPPDPPPADWVTGAAAVRPSVHSVWGTLPALEGRASAFSPLGTGFVLYTDSAGASLLTNAHVVADVSWALHPRVSVLVQSDTGAVLLPVLVAALDTLRDLALLRVPDTTLVPAGWESERVPMGTAVATIGFGLPEGGIVDTAEARVTTRFTVTPRLTTGYSSAYRTLRPGESASNVLEMDLPLFPGVSGGPLFTREGRVIGVNRGGWRVPEGIAVYGQAITPLVVRQFLEAAGDSAGVARLERVVPGPGR